jgi:galactokinase
MNDLVSIMADKFRNHFGVEPLLVVSPGRVNLIGEHTDYNEGFVLPGATDKSVVMALSPHPDGLCHFVARDLDQEFRCDLGSLHKSPLRWPDYLQGVIDQFLRSGRKIGGFNCVFGGDIPIGAGMSSSAAIEGGLAFGLNHLYKLGIDDLTLVKLAQQAENEFVGVRCGIMDQFVNIHGRERSVLKLDCRSLEFEYVPFEREDLRIVVCDTLVRRELAGSEYNVRRGQCEEAVALLRSHEPSIRSLRDVSLDLLREHETEFDPVILRRAKYVVEENGRVEEATADLLRGDFNAFGERMKASHAGLRDGYEVSSPELDALVDAASGLPGVLGARMMGAGFGGCTINLVEADAVPEFRERVAAIYEAVFEKAPAVHVIRIEAGTRLAPSA